MEKRKVPDITNLRRHLRLSVQFRSLLSNPGHPDAVGMVVDISPHGCRIRSTSPVFIGMPLRLLIEVPEEESPICVERAAVRWVRGQQFGLEFVTFATPEYERLARVVQALQ